MVPNGHAAANQVEEEGKLAEEEKGEEVVDGPQDEGEDELDGLLPEVCLSLCSPYK